jgi:hypothetical protein
VARLVEAGDAAWKTLQAELAADKGAIVSSFPAPDSAAVPADQVIGRRVVIEGVRYPDNQFMESGREFLFVGDGQKGYYYLDLSGRGWRTAYAALRRFRSFVTDDLPLPWLVVGTITGLDLIVPQAGLERTMAAQYGWVVEPEAILVPDRTVAWRAPEGESQGSFAGEDELAAMRAEHYTVTAIPEDVEPMDLIRIFATAIKERNWDLYIAAVDESWTTTPRAEERLRYYWDINQRLYRELFVHIEPSRILQDIVIQGERFSEFDDIFLTDEDRAEIAARAEPLIEQVMIEALRYNEHGTQERPASWIQLRRYEGGRWYIYSPQPF